ncbi:DUF1990 family protein [Urbifossiella limnaea]|uniref:DUF1990 domain-containing protein n=1 Tax=Urbifossiella limnaea TaxID=2528023 RepID=A0A517XRG5_9BACT|nr:DUF1990 domain-containing protein [Urbifossiella limnaea]QDU20089.1 hypothetical protein ETAA1_20320 [Urbifossiella limnaea]
MILFRRPTPAALDAFRAAQAKLSFTYLSVGSTAATPPPGYTVDRTRVRLGEGEAVFRTARAALVRWEQFNLGWASAHPADLPLRPGEVVAVVARLVGVWWVNAARIAYAVDEPTRFGFAYGTLPDHAESGEERFLVEWDRATDTVWYDIVAFSRPRHPLTRLGYPLTRRAQRRFAHDSAAAMRRAVISPPTP